MALSSSSTVSHTSSGTESVTVMLDLYILLCLTYTSYYACRLHLPGQVTEDGREKAVFDIEKGLHIYYTLYLLLEGNIIMVSTYLLPGIMTVHLPKLQTGEHFNNLGMLTSLLSHKPVTPSSSQKPLIEVIGGGRITDC